MLARYSQYGFGGLKISPLWRWWLCLLMLSCCGVGGGGAGAGAGAGVVVIAALFSCVCGRKVRNSNIIKEIDLC